MLPNDLHPDGTWGGPFAGADWLWQSARLPSRRELRCCGWSNYQVSSMAVDASTFENAVNSYYESLYRFAFSLAGQEADACDLTQETFQQFARKGDQLRDAAKVKSWLFTTLYREFLDSRRARQRHPQVEMSEVEAELPVSQPDVEVVVDAATARAALAQVEEVFRAPLALFYLGEHSYAEIAKILDVPIGTVMSRISRGRNLLRALLADEVNGKRVPLPLPKTKLPPADV
jgi:RNA polymerase sigma-70 factor (ECF subfamily)